MGTRLSKRKTAAMAALFVLLCACAFCSRAWLRYSPFAASRALEAPSGVFSGESGQTYVIDNGKKTVLVVGADEKLKHELRAGENAFYYASLVCEGGDGSVYVADVLYSGEGTRIAAERVFRYDRDSSRAQTVYEIVYADTEEAPMQYGRITDMRERDGKLTLAVITPAGAEIREVDTDTGAVVSTQYHLEVGRLSDLSFHPETRLPVFTTRRGAIGWANAEGAVHIAAESGFGEHPWTVSTEGNYIYYCDLGSPSVTRIAMSGGERETAAYGAEGLISFARVTGETVGATDGTGVYTGRVGGRLSYCTAVPLAFTVDRMFAWGALALSVPLAFALVVTGMRAFLRQKRREVFRHVVIVLVVTVVMCVLSSSITISRMLEASKGEMMTQLRFFGDIMVSNVDAGLLRQIDGAEDYGGEAYSALKSGLDRLADMTYDNGLYDYYGIYVTDGKTIYGVTDYEDTITARHPFYEYGTAGYTEAFEGETVEVSMEVSAYGAWAFVIRPIFDGDGGVAGVLEVGTSLDNVRAQNAEFVKGLALSVATAAVVLAMLVIEGILLLGYFEKRRSGQRRRRSDWMPLRPMVFLAFTADCVQDAFVAIYADGLFTPFLGLPRELGAALPISLQVLAAAAAAIICGSVMRRYSARRTLFLGFAAQAAGLAVCAAVGTYAALLFGKALIGGGLGFIIVSANSEAAGTRESERAEAFASITAGVLAGVTVGAGISSLVLSYVSFRGAFAAGAVLAGAGALLVAACGPVPDTPTRAESQQGQINLIRFLTGRGILSFYLLLLVPFMIMLSFREYFFPLFSAESGMREADIGRVYLLCGVAAIYAGPWLLRTLIAKFGEKRTVVLASVLICFASLAFAAAPNMTAAIAGVALLSIAASFGYSAQAAYYADLPAAAAYGESRAMGVYAVFDHGGQTLGPIIYALALLPGKRAAALVMGAGFTCLLILFIVLNWKKECS
jgi:predicted MFS family arabinose efflux permease